MNTQINVALLLRVADQIAKTPDRFHMGLWECGTTACIAGWACRLADGFPVNESRVKDRAVELLGLKDLPWGMLFHEAYWPWEFISYREESPANRAAKAVLRIHAFLDEHAAGWRDHKWNLNELCHAGRQKT